MMSGNDTDAEGQTGRNMEVVRWVATDQIPVREQQPHCSLCSLREVDDGSHAGIRVRIVAANGK
jgi:hypothetical protein